MKVCRYVPRNTAAAPSPRYGLIEGENVIEITGLPWGQWTPSAHSSRLADVRLLAPVEPSKIVCVGRNYAAHAAELGNEVPKEPFKDIRFVFVENMRQVFREALGEKVVPPASPAPRVQRVPQAANVPRPA